MSMDICSRIGLPATDNINGHGLCKNTLKSTHGVLKHLSVDELSVDVTNFLNIQDTIEEDSSSSTPTPRNSSEFHKKDLCDKFIPGKIMTQSPKKCLSKDAPPLGKTASHQDVITSESSTYGDTIKSNDPSGFRSISLPVSILHTSLLNYLEKLLNIIHAYLTIIIYIYVLYVLCRPI